MSTVAILDRDELTAQRAREIMREIPFDDSLEGLALCDCANDLIIIRGGQAGCLRCGETTQTGKQIWKCYCCGTCRVWGLDFPLDVAAAKLNCIRCGSLVPHRFMMVTRGR